MISQLETDCTPHLDEPPMQDCCNAMLMVLSSNAYLSISLLQQILRHLHAHGQENAIANRGLEVILPRNLHGLMYAQVQYKPRLEKFLMRHDQKYELRRKIDELLADTEVLYKEVHSKRGSSVVLEPGGVSRYLTVESRIHFRYDRFENRIVCYNEDDWDMPDVGPRLEVLSDYHVVRLAKDMSNFGFAINRQPEYIMTYIKDMARRDEFDSAIDRLSALPETPLDESIQLLESFMSAVTGHAPTAYNRALGVYLFASLAARVLDPGHKVDGVLVLTGLNGYGGQGVGKQLLFKAMCLEPGWYKELELDLSSTELARSLHGSVLVELCELRMLDSRDEERIKKFITSTNDYYRALYSNFFEDHPRRCVLVASSNHEYFLSDATGNRRWFPYGVNQDLNIDWVRDRVEKLWSAGVTAFLEVGIARLYQNVLDLLAEETRLHTIEPPLTERIRQLLIGDILPSQFSTQDVIHALGVTSAGSITRLLTIQVGNALRFLDYRNVSHRDPRTDKVKRQWVLCNTSDVVIMWNARMEIQPDHTLHMLMRGFNLTDFLKTSGLAAGVSAEHVGRVISKALLKKGWVIRNGEISYFGWDSVDLKKTKTLFII